MPSDTTLLGRLQHLADGERYWCSYTVGGDQTYADPTFSMLVPEGRTGAKVVADYRAAIEACNAQLALVGTLDALTAMPVDGVAKTVRWVVTHLTSETVRHAGHADILRELIDGEIGR